jgi:hypothetical protein
MVIGLKVTNPRDLARGLKFDIAMDKYSASELEEFFNSEASEHNPYFVFSMDFNWFCVLSKGIIFKYKNINKIRQIVFDSSTFKFMSNLKLLAILYYLTLEQDGSIYIESNSAMCVGQMLTNSKELSNLVKFDCKNGFYYQQGYIISKLLELSLGSTAKKVIEPHITTQDKIYSQNTQFLSRWFYGSRVEVLDEKMECYPLSNELYPITKFYKITKKLAHDAILDHVLQNVQEYESGLNLKTTTILLE